MLRVVPKHRLARVRLLRRRQHLVEPLPIHLPVAPVELRYDHIREALDLALGIRPVRRLDETLHVGERLGGVARADLARMAFVVVDVVPCIDEQLLRTAFGRHARKRLLNHFAVGHVARRVVVVRHVAVVDDQVNADVAEELVGEPCARTAFLRLADVRIGHQTYLQQRFLRRRRPEPRKRHERNRAADECPSCRLHFSMAFLYFPSCDSARCTTSVLTMQNMQIMSKSWEAQNCASARNYRLRGPFTHDHATDSFCCPGNLIQDVSTRGFIFYHNHVEKCSNNRPLNVLPEKRRIML